VQGADPGNVRAMTDRPVLVERSGTTSSDRVGWAVLVLGAAGAGAATIADARGARAAASQDWSPFVLVTGLLLVGWVAEHDGLFAFIGGRIARVSKSGAGLFVSATLLVAVVTALLNLDTSVAFLTPVFVYTARSRGTAERPLLYGVLLLSNAGSLFLPGSNLTNLIVLGHLRLTGTTFLADMWAPALASLAVTAAVVGISGHRELRATSLPTAPAAASPGLGVGLWAVIAVAVLVLVVPAPALAIAAVGVAVAVVRVAQDPDVLSPVLRTLGGPLLLGLFGIAVALGDLGRAWSGPATLLTHLGAVGTAVVAAVASIACNNLPAASLLAARTPKDPFALLVGLNLGPNLCVTGSLAWLLWLRAAQSAGARPSLRRASRLGAIAVPLSMAAALVVLAAKGTH